jgi:hypothetical protein
MGSGIVAPVGLGDLVAEQPDVLRLAVAAYLARFKGISRKHTESDLRVFLTWCTQRQLSPLQAQRARVELYVRWMQEVRQFQPSTVGRRLSVVCGFYRTAVLDGLLEHSPAEHVRRPLVPTDSPTLGQQPGSHPTATTSPWSPCSACSDCGSSKPPAPTSPTSAKNTATGSCVCTAKATRPSSSRCHPPWAARWTGRSSNALSGRSCATAAVCEWTATSPPAAYATSPPSPACACHGCTPTCSATPSSPPCWTPTSTCAMFRSPPATPTPAPPCATTAHAKTSTATPTTSSPPTWPPPLTCRSSDVRRGSAGAVGARTSMRRTA